MTVLRASSTKLTLTILILENCNQLKFSGRITLYFTATVMISTEARVTSMATNAICHAVAGRHAGKKY